MEAQPLWSRFSADPRTHGKMRASDADRAVVTDVLSEAYAQGQIDPDELDERIDSAGKIKTLDEIPALVEDLVAAEADVDAGVDVEGGELDDATRARALSRLSGERIPITPEQIDAAAQKYYRDRVRNAVLGMFAGPAGITLAIWAFSSFASGRLIFFWPIFVILPMLFGAISQIANRESLIRNRKRELMTRARAHLGDAEAKRQLDARPRTEDEDYEDTWGPGLQPPHPSHPPYAPDHSSPRNEIRGRRRQRRRRRGNPWD